MHTPFARTLCDWSRDGKRLSIQITGFIYTDIEIIEPTDEGHLRTIHSYSPTKRAVEYDLAVFHGWSPVDPQRILLVRGRLRDTGFGSFALYAGSASEGAGQLVKIAFLKLGKHQVLPLYATWSADGKYVAYENEGGVFIVSVDKPEPTLLVTGVQPRWCAQ